MVACPIRLQERCEIFIGRVFANGSRPEHGPESVIHCDGSHPAPWLFYHEARATSGRVWHRFCEGCFRRFADRCHRKSDPPTLRYHRVEFPRIFGIRIPNILRIIGIPEGTPSQKMAPPSFAAYRRFAAMRSATSTHL